MSQKANFQCEKQTKQNKSRASVISVDLTDSLWRKFWIIWDLSHRFRKIAKSINLSQMWTKKMVSVA